MKADGMRARLTHTSSLAETTRARKVMRTIVEFFLHIPADLLKRYWNAWRDGYSFGGQLSSADISWRVPIKRPSTAIRRSFRQRAAIPSETQDQFLLVITFPLSAKRFSGRRSTDAESPLFSAPQTRDMLRPAWEARTSLHHITYLVEVAMAWVGSVNIFAFQKGVFDGGSSMEITLAGECEVTVALLDAQMP